MSVVLVNKRLFLFYLCGKEEILMNYVTAIFETITSAVSAFMGTLGEAINGITSLFWTTGDNAGPTFLGVLMLIVAGIGLVYGCFRLIRGLIYQL